MVGYYITNTNIFNRKGHNIQIFKTIEGLRNADVPVELVCPRYRRHRHEALDEFSREYTVKTPFPVHFLWMPSARPTRFGFFYFTIAAFFWLLARSVKERPQFFYFRSEYLFPLMWIGQLFKTPFFYEIHRVGLKQRAQYLKEKIAARATGIVVISGVLEKIFKPLNQNCIVAHDGVDISHFESDETKHAARKKLGIPEAQTVALYAGSVNKIKGVDVIVRNAEVFKEVMFYVLGRVGTDMQKEIESAPRNVFFLGAYTQPELPSYLRAADVLLIPQPEGPQSQSPMKLFEYMAIGRPVLSSNLPNLLEVLPRECNLFYQAGDDADYRAKLGALIAAKDAYGSRAIFNRTHVRTFTWTERGKNIGKLITDSLG